MKKRADGRYQMSVIVGYGDRGKALRKTVYGKTIKETKDKAAELRHQVAKGNVLKGQEVTVSALAGLWYEVEKAPSLKPQTLAGLKSTLNSIDRYIGAVRVTELDISHLDSMRVQLIGQGHYSAYNRALNVLKGILNFGIRNGYLNRNITLGMPRLKVPKKHVKRALTPFELKAIESADLSPANKLFIDLLRYGGMRFGEALALDIKDLDPIRREVTISKTGVAYTNSVQDVPKTSAGVRSIPLPPVFWSRNEDYIKSRHPSEPVLMTSTYNRKSFTAARKQYKQALEQIFNGNVPEDLTPHIFRHNYATELYKSGIARTDIKAAQYLLGHSDIKTTLDIYTHFDGEQLDRSKLDNYFNVSHNLVSGKRDA